MENILENKSGRNDVIKLIAAITMVIDHVGYMFFPFYINPNFIIFRIIGRIAFPIFAYYVAMGFKRTSNFKNYIKRMAIFAIITQLPFYFFSGKVFYLNVMVTFLFALLMLYFWEKNKILPAIIMIIIPELLSADYGAYGVLMVLVFYLYGDNLKKSIISVALLTLVYTFFTYGFTTNLLAYVQMCCIVAIPILFISTRKNFKMFKYFFYWFYPVHITILVLIQYLIGIVGSR